MAALGDSQILRTIRAVRRRTVRTERVERLYAELVELERRARRRNHCPWYAERQAQVRRKIWRTMYVPDYVTVEMEHKSHYDHIFEYGFKVNGKRYVRLSCSAGQARASTVVFCAEDIVQEVRRRINNGRDMSKKLAPSKFNAYFGLAGSATRRVSAPRFAVVPDFVEKVRFRAHFDTETDWSQDDDMDEREVETEIDRMDGMGLISPAQAQKWAEELGLDYVPCQFCVRQSFLKGMLCVFPFHEFCEEVNGGNYLVKTVYKDLDGEPVMADLRECDVIITESQFKLWDSWPTQEDYIRCCDENGLYWGVAQYTPKRAKDILTLNYQFIQTLNLGPREVEKLCEPFIQWVEKAALDDPDYMLLFLTGQNHTPESVNRFWWTDDQWWVKALVANPACARDPYIRGKIRELIRGRIGGACMGEIFVRGNFQVLVSDPYAMMQFLCGMEPAGLLGPGEYYSAWWNRLGVKEVDTMRSPLTYRSEHVVAKLVQNEQTEKWYRYCNLGFIVNWHGHETVNWAGSDWDYDIIATTDNPVMIGGVYRDELPVTYDAPRPEKKAFTEKDLFEADKFSFGSIIGSITNKSTNAYALLPVVEAQYGRGSEEAALVLSRLRQCCVAQSRAIDKTKIGQPVKGIPDAWIHRGRVEEGAGEAERGRVELLNRCLISRRPYFFRHRYPDARRKHDAYRSSRDCVCQSLFGMTVDELERAPRRTKKQKEWLKAYHEYSPLVESDSPMNLVCRQIEQMDFEVARKFRAVDGWEPEIYLTGDGRRPDGAWKEVYADVAAAYERCARDISDVLARRETGFDREWAVQKLRRDMSFVCSNPEMVCDCIVRRLMIEKRARNTDLLWMGYGRYLVRAASQSAGRPPEFPVPDENGDIEYLGRRYRRVGIDVKMCGEGAYLDAKMWEGGAYLSEKM